MQKFFYDKNVHEEKNAQKCSNVHKGKNAFEGRIFDFLSIFVMLDMQAFFWGKSFFFTCAPSPKSPPAGLLTKCTRPFHNFLYYNFTNFLHF